MGHSKSNFIALLEWDIKTKKSQQSFFILFFKCTFWQGKAPTEKKNIIFIFGTIQVSELKFSEWVNVPSFEPQLYTF